MKHYEELQSTQDFDNEIQFSKEFTDFVKVHSTEFIVEFTFEIKPVNKNSIGVYAAEDEQTQECIPHIASGISEFITDCNLNGISVKGFDFFVFNGNTASPADFRPGKYRFYTKRHLQRLALDSE